MSLHPASAPGFPVVTLASSFGGVAALRRIVAALPRDFPAAVVAVQHLPADLTSHLPRVLGWRARLAVGWARAGERLCPGRVYLAPRARHLLVLPGDRLALSDSPKVCFTRPAADVLFTSAAGACGSRVVAVVLTGFGSDGADGVVAVKAAGGVVLAQDAATSDEGAMPAAAVATGAVDQVLPLGEIAAALVRLVAAPV